MPPKKFAKQLRQVRAAPKQNEKLTLKQMQQMLTPKEQQMYNKLFSIIDNRKFGEIITICEQLLAKVPNHCEILAFEGFAVYYLNSKEYDTVKKLVPEPNEFTCREAGLKILKKAAQLCDKQSHIPYQLLASVTRQSKELKTAIDSYKTLLSIPNFKNSYVFNRDISIALFYDGEFKEAAEHAKAAIANADKDSKETLESYAITFGIAGSTKNMVVAEQEFDQFIEKQLKTREHTIRMKEASQKVDQQYNTSLAEYSQILAYQTYFHMLHKEPKEQIAQLEKLLENTKYFDREGANQQIINIIIDNKL